jgi:cytochrome-b5 reductase
VYNVTPYLRYHPGGADILARAAGTDATQLFNRYHPWVNAAALLERCLIGPLHKPPQAAGEAPPPSLRARLAAAFRP